MLIRYRRLQNVVRKETALLHIGSFFLANEATVVILEYISNSCLTSTTILVAPPKVTQPQSNYCLLFYHAFVLQLYKVTRLKSFPLWDFYKIQKFFSPQSHISICLPQAGVTSTALTLQCYSTRHHHFLLSLNRHCHPRNDSTRPNAYSIHFQTNIQQLK